MPNSYLQCFHRHTDLTSCQSGISSTAEIRPEIPCSDLLFFNCFAGLPALHVLPNLPFLRLVFPLRLSLQWQSGIVYCVLDIHQHLLIK
jgi:hypothetical protein